MRRAVLAALATGTVITSALGIGSATPVTVAELRRDEFASARTRDAARNAQRARIEARYLVERARCPALGGAERDQCLINAHAARGRALLEAAAPYENRG
jgi:hypothetical protein